MIRITRQGISGLSYAAAGYIIEAENLPGGGGWFRSPGKNRLPRGIRLMTTFERVYEAVKQIPEGSVASYGQVAEAIGGKHLSRAVGYALHVNPQPGVIPCHRVVKKDGEVSSAFAFGGKNRQIELLQAEGVGFRDETHVDMARFRVSFLPLI